MFRDLVGGWREAAALVVRAKVDGGCLGAVASDTYGRSCTASQLISVAEHRGAKGGGCSIGRDTSVAAAVDQQASTQGEVGGGWGVGEAVGVCMPGRRSYSCGYYSPFPDKENQGLPVMLIIAWKLIIQHFYQIDGQSAAFTDHSTISKLTLARFAKLALEAKGSSAEKSSIKRRIFFNSNSCSGTNASIKE
jgi:hypothetical protein